MAFITAPFIEAENPSALPAEITATLETAVQQLAATQHSSSRPARLIKSKPPLLVQLAKQSQFFDQTFHHFSQIEQTDNILSYAAEWILDNFSLVQETIRQIREDLPIGYYYELPRLENTAWQNYPRIYGLAHEIVTFEHGQLTFDTIREAVLWYQRYQPTTPLPPMIVAFTMGELWAFPTMLRLALLDSLANALEQLIPGLASHAENGHAPDKTLRNPPVSNEALVGYCITSLRLLTSQDWMTFMESVSQVEQILRVDPAAIYATMDFETRNMYRTAVEQLARATNHSEDEVARQAIVLSRSRQAAVSADSVVSDNHVGYYLIGRGRQQLEVILDYRPPIKARIQLWGSRQPSAIYLGSIALLTAVLVTLAVIYALNASGGAPFATLAAGLLIFLPATAVASTVVNWLITTHVAPRRLPRLDFQKGIPPVHQTMVVVPALLTTLEDIDSLAQQLELHFVRNPDPSLSFALLTDYPDAPSQHLPGDAALIAYAQVKIEALNTKYQQPRPPFYLFHRERRHNPSQNCWMGWERKRGKLIEFNQLLRPDPAWAPTSYSVQVGDLRVLPLTKYIITLDADTILTEDSAQRLVSALAHPLNRPVYDSQHDKVTAGYSILQPRTEVKPTSANQSPFTRIFAGDVGLDLYTHAVSDVYQDVFGAGIYVGKGIYEVDTFMRSLDQHMPDNSLLSHDLFEGLFARVALLTDTQLLEDFPQQYLAHTKRLHRWIRGDWQLVPWLLDRKRAKDLSLLDSWKIIDNMRRSLVMPALLLLFMAGWLALPGSPLVWTLLGVGTLGVSLFTGVINRLVNRPAAAGWRDLLRPVQLDALRWLMALIFLPFEALLALNAIVVTLWRLFVTHRNMLEWTTAAQTARLFSGRRGFMAEWGQMISSPLLAIGLMVLIGWLNPSALAVALPLLIAWLIAPQIAYSISQPVSQPQRALSNDQEQKLRHIARQTWLFFEHMVGPEDQWLPPDHFQESPARAVAHRTSPTNIGLLILSTLAAYDFGYIGQMELIVRLQSTFETLAKLERYRGHLLNWYDTRTLEPLSPRYVSTVDSGNWAGALIALKQACLELPAVSILRTQRWQGLLDTLVLLEVTFDGLKKNIPAAHFAKISSQTREIRQRVQAVKQAVNQQPTILAWLNEVAWVELSRLILSLMDSETPISDPEALGDLRIASDRVYHHLSSMQRDANLLLPWLLPLRQPPPLMSSVGLEPAITAAWNDLLVAIPKVTPPVRGTSDVCQQLLARVNLLYEMLSQASNPAATAASITEARTWCTKLADQLTATQVRVLDLINGFQALAAAVENEFQAMDFSFLYHTQRQVFYIGYNVTAGKFDENFYDLLASEARLASLLAIAKRDVPQTHWLHLGRPVTKIDDQRVLLSWSGTMFEYLMPSLLMESYEQTLLTQSSRAAVRHQIDYGRTKNVPWGISEAGYYAFGSNLDYQYQAFGVPGLGFKRGLSDDLVMTPYASLLALRFDPQAVRHNIDQLDAAKMRGRYGFYEAIDYTRSRLLIRQDHAIVREYMAHHQGMILVSIANYLLKDLTVKRFHADPRVQSVELLLQEKIPDQAPVEYPNQDQTILPLPSVAHINTAPWSVPVESETPRIHVISNGQLGTLITNAGSGHSFWQGLALTRWRPDTTRDNWGQWLYIQDQDSGALWSATYQPTAATYNQTHQAVWFSSYQAEFQRTDDAIALTLQLTIAPDDDVEIRRVTLINQGNKTRHLKLVSYGEVLLAAPMERHPAFNKMFIESEYVSAQNLLLFNRRLRSDSESPVYLGHSILTEPGTPVTASYEADRLRFIGRGMTTRLPQILQGIGKNSTALSKSVGATLDPIMSLAQAITLLPHTRTHLAYLTTVGHSRESVLDLTRQYRVWSAIDSAFERARRQNDMALQQIELDTSKLIQIQELLSLLLYPHAGLRAADEVLSANRTGQAGLWGHAISGDYPILLVQLADTANLGLIEDVLRAHSYWRSQQLMIDLVILNTHDSSYSQDLNDNLRRLMIRSNSNDWLNRRGGIFVVNADQLRPADRTLLQSVARAILDDSQGSMAEQIARQRSMTAVLPSFVPSRRVSDSAMPPFSEPLLKPADLMFDNGFGGFTADGKEYVIYLTCDQWSPLPWVNIIANPDFGCMVSEAGLGCSWAINSGENRLTSWRNDPVSDPPGEALYIRDEETAVIWSPTPLPSRDTEPYLIRHGAGYTTFQHHSQGLKQLVQVFIAPDAPVKIVRLCLENIWNRPRRVTITYFAEWVLGVDRDETQPYIVSAFDHDSGALLAYNGYSTEFGERVAFLAANKTPHGLTTDREEFLGRLGDLNQPEALGRVGLASRVGAGFDPCAVLQLHVDLAVGAQETVYFLVGQGSDQASSLALVKRFSDSEQVQSAWQATQTQWDTLLSTVTVNTPDPAMNVILNRWLLYQTLACRLWGRTAFYQSSGAYGYRDQLQDVMALLHAAPQLAREHILRAAQYQFEAGDVLHWWHPPSGRGVRTRIADDLLWLPYVVTEYIEVTGDIGILDENIPFLQGELLRGDEIERYAQYSPTAQSFSLYEHCVRAIKHGSTQGTHGLPLMGTGDWNDGMNLVGAGGHGESVWLGWFLFSVLKRFAALSDLRADSIQSTLFCQWAETLQKALESSTWDGDWYLRAFYDDGTPLGSAKNRDGQIDSIAQSWSVLSAAGSTDRVNRAMQAVSERLIRTKDQLILLLDPPFSTAPNSPGYIKGYPPGIRENGGQYTHAATWVIWAFAKLGQGTEAVRLFQMINPIGYSDTAEKAKRYKVEPYVVAADVYSTMPHVGRGGWTWYTGSASWLYRLGIEAILGIHRNGHTLQIDPCIPADWPSYDVTYRDGKTTYEIHVRNPQQVQRGVIHTTLDGQIVVDGKIPLIGDGQVHKVQIELGVLPKESSSNLA